MGCQGSEDWPVTNSPAPRLKKAIFKLPPRIDSKAFSPFLEITKNEHVSPPLAPIITTSGVKMKK